MLSRDTKKWVVPVKCASSIFLLLGGSRISDLSETHDLISQSVIVGTLLNL
jgi:hypothetical protein